jgi:hypothetical protein
VEDQVCKAGVEEFLGLQVVETKNVKVRFHIFFFILSSKNKVYQNFPLYVQ